MARTLSLTVPTGHLTLGNLLGAIRHWAADQRGSDSLYGVADLHALTTEHDPASVRALTIEQVALLVAAGLDPHRCTIFVQSHVPAHTDLHWLLEATAYDGELRRMVQYKEKAARQRSVRSALLAYPVLMAADILLYDVETVPVGDDQRQHLELARDLATRFNKAYGETFVVPRAVTAPVAARLMDLQDPARKMSKSAAPSAPGVLRLLDPPDVIRRKVARAVTDSGRDVVFDAVGKPGVASLLTILAACTGISPAAAAAQLDTYSELKEKVTAAVIAVLDPLQRRYADVRADPAAVLAIAREGAAQAQELAAPTLARAKTAIGLLSA
ncbi:MAG TPA: tryptophan--tRNA ligase [Streptosporangiaceae bacterium]|nr:tryptophan--tRNA ligase [Streptosporangiaceae bacterium]